MKMKAVGWWCPILEIVMKTIRYRYKVCEGGYNEACDKCNGKNFVRVYIKEGKGK